MSVSADLVLVTEDVSVVRNRTALAVDGRAPIVVGLDPGVTDARAAAALVEAALELDPHVLDDGGVCGPRGGGA